MQLSQGPYGYNRFDAYEKQLQEVANYQPPPMAQAPPAQIQQSNQPAPEARKAPTAGRAASAAKNKSYFNTSNLANRLGMKAGGDQASVVTNYDQGTVTRINDGIPYNMEIGQSGAGMGNYYSGRRDYDSAYPVGSGKSADGRYRVNPIEDEPFGPSAEDMPRNDPYGYHHDGFTGYNDPTTGRTFPNDPSQTPGTEVYNTLSNSHNLNSQRRTKAGMSPWGVAPPSRSGQGTMDTSASGNPYSSGKPMHTGRGY